MNLLQNIKILLFSLFFVSCCLTTLTAQLTIVDDQDFQVEGTTLESSISANIYMAVGEEEIGQFYWELTRSEELPDEWKFSVCDLVTCYNFGIEECPVDKPNVIATTADTIKFSLYLNNFGVEGSGSVKLRLWPKGQVNNTLVEPSVSYEIQFASNTVDTEIVTDVTITPNPVADLFGIEMVLSKSNSVEVDVVNSIGQVVSSETVNIGSGMSRLTFDASDYSNGVYSVITRSDAGITTTKFIVSK